MTSMWEVHDEHHSSPGHQVLACGSNAAGSAAKEKQNFEERRGRLGTDLEPPDILQARFKHQSLSCQDMKRLAGNALL